jgi:hypothetical protein
MKKLSFLFLVILTFTLRMSAQVPQGINYQTVVRNNSGTIISNQNVNFRLSIISGSPTGNIEYIEAHPVATNSIGLINLVIGQGTPLSGTFSSINWGSASHYLSVELDPTGGTAFQSMGTSQLMSVPYALSAGNTSTSMAQLTDVKVTGVTDGQTLKWNSAQSKWLPANDIGGGTGDNWGTQAVVTDNTLSGTGTSANNLKIAQQGATTGQALKWNGSAWLPAADLNTDAQTLSISGSSLSISGGNAVTLPSGGGNGDIVVLTSSNYLSATIGSDRVVNVQGTITLSSNYNSVNNNGIFITGGTFSGSGQTIYFGLNAVVSGVKFNNVLLDGSNVTFINCTFTGVNSFPFNCNVQSSTFNSCNTTAVSKIGSIVGSSVSASSIQRIDRISNSQIYSSSTIGGASSPVLLMSNNYITLSTVYCGGAFTGNILDEAPLYIKPASGNTNFNVTGNGFLTSSTSWFIDVDISTGSRTNINIGNNSFTGNSTYPNTNHVKITGAYTGTRCITKVHNNAFIGGTGVAVFNNATGSADLVVNDNDILYTGGLGVSTGGFVYVRNNLTH